MKHESTHTHHNSRNNAGFLALLKRIFISYPAALFIITLALFFANYVPGTWLTGWDNLHPEFNFQLNFERNITGVWQEYRGLGLYDGQAHMANLIHTLVAFILSFILPLELIRYVITSACLFIGGFGLYTIARHITHNRLASFFAALFYMFNIGTVQQFITPLESFVIHFAFLPWTFLFAIRYIRGKHIGDALLFFVVAILSTPQAFIPTIFVTFSLTFFTLALYDAKVNNNIKQFFVLGLLLFAVNAFWFLPYAKGALSNADVIRKSRINQFTSEENYLRNKTRGTLLNVISLKGFMMDLDEYDGEKQEHFKLLGVWEDYSYTIPYIAGFIFLLSLIAAGFVLGIRHKKAVMLPVVASVGISFFFLSNNVLLIRELNEFVRSLVPVLAEALRNPFTKFIVIFTFGLSICLAYGFTYALERFKKHNLLTIVTAFAILFISLPAFSGNLYAPILKRPIPEDYFQMFSYLNTQDTTARIAYLPAENYWSWQAWSWGYTGSGNTWFGIPQPLLVRAFDPWSTYNEQFYNEFSFAIKNNDAPLLYQVLQKYNVSYLLLDEYRVDSVSEKDINYRALKALIADIPEIEREKATGKLTLYRNTEAQPRMFGLPVQNTPKVGSQYYLTHMDEAFASLGNYVVNADNPDVIYPFPSLYTDRAQQDIQFSTSQSKTDFTLSSFPLASFDHTKYNLRIPDILNEHMVPLRFELQGTTAQTRQLVALPVYPSFEGLSENTATISAQPLLEVPLSTASAILVQDPSQRARVGETFYVPNNAISSITMVSNGQEYEFDIDLTSVTLRNRLVRLARPVEQVGLTFSKNNALAYKKMTIDNGNVVIGHPSGRTITNTPHSYIEQENKGSKTNFILKARDNEIAAVTYQENLPHATAYVGFPYVKHSSGLPVTFFIDNPVLKRVELETKLDPDRTEQVIILPESPELSAMNTSQEARESTESAKGYAFHFNLKSVGSEVAKTEIQDFFLYPIPYNVITTMRFERIDSPFVANAGQTRNTEIENITFSQLSYTGYTATVKPDSEQYLVLDQAFDTGWEAYEVSSLNWFTESFPFIGGSRVKEHVLINNWENGWYIPASDNEKYIVIVFMPQYLQYVGFGIFFMSIIILLGLLVIKKNQHSNHTPLPKHMHS